MATHSVKISEAAFTRQVLTLARLWGWLAYHPRPGRTADGWRTPLSGDAGFPDLVLVRGDRVIFAELKTSRGKLSIAQCEWIARLKNTGATVYVWRPADWPEIERVLA